MTTVAYRDGVMASDSRGFSGDRHPIGCKAKISRLSDGTLLGVSSVKIGTPDAFRRAVEKHGLEADLDDEFDATAIAVRPDGRIYYFASGRNFTGPLEAEFITIGTGEAYAYGAMKMGAGPERAVEIAIESDVWSAGPVQAFSL